jgi:energy-coupling factor transport system substrate-specific component
LVLDEKGYLLVAFLVALLSLAVFLTGFEKKQTGSRRLVIASVLIALSVAGRFIPLLKPVTAVTVLAAVYLGGETGFLVGSLSALLSDFYFGQGPWTPFQMLAWGLIGLFAAWLSRPLRKSRTLLLIYGLLSAILYSALMDVWTVLWASQTITLSIYLAALLTALPHTILYAVSNVIFLALLAKPFGEKLERVKIKYGV